MKSQLIITIETKFDKELGTEEDPFNSRELDEEFHRAVRSTIRKKIENDEDFHTDVLESDELWSLPQEICRFQELGDVDISFLEEE